ncbi:TonB-dependent receptor [Sphingopyxis sp. Root214]|uniref:TonB-dependent receptor n=1 Tax=unclassified Sphingopyxis TaxID=2614943 RepID=UPI0006F4F486|nr:MULTISPECIES: TonB-dependent receptor [unclassified Sphingopyxis]KQZ76618.1 TonB-dependent receptor [Sphingopyxis sp. Root154]KRC09495.1 TonB-dependent receptor [Sphingopyxis sp. Root214]
MTNRRFQSTLFALLGGAATFAAPAATAQTSSETIPGEIVVTAQRRAEKLQDVPISITAFGSEQIKEQRLTGAADLVGVVPNLQSTSTSGDATPIFSLRGISMSDYSFNQSGPVATYFDEVYRGNIALLGVSMFDLERVEVLRGPQGTLYGKNTTGGAINFISRVPTFETAGNLSVGVGNYDRHEASGAVQTALGDTLAARVAFTFARADGTFHNLLAGQPDPDSVREYGIRGTLLFEPSDDVKFVLRAATSLQNPWNYGLYAEPTAAGIGGGVYSQFHAIDPVAYPLTDYFRTGLDPRELEANAISRRRNRTYSLSLTGNVALGSDLTLTSISSWNRGTLFSAEDGDTSPLKVIEIEYFGKATQLAQDLRISSDFGGPFNFILGAYYDEEKVYNRTLFPFYQDLDVDGNGSLNGDDCLAGFPLACQIRNSFDQKKSSLAVYSDFRFTIGEALTLRGGLRYTHDKGDLRNFISQAIGPDDVTLINLIPGSSTDLDATTGLAFRKDNVSGKIGVDYQAGRDVLLYASYSRGYRGSAFNAQALFDPSELTIAKPETIDSYEAGFKSQLFDRMLQLNGALFYYGYKNQQFIDIDPVSAAQRLVNLPRSRIIGAELELVARPTDGLQLNGSIGLLDTKVKEGTLQGVSIVGNELANAPRFSASFGANWKMIEMAPGSIHLHVDGHYSSKQWFELQNMSHLRQKPYTLVNGSISFESADDKWKLSIWGKNIFDKFYYTSRLDVSNFGFITNHIGAPRTYGVSLDYKF